MQAYSIACHTDYRSVIKLNTHLVVVIDKVVLEVSCILSILIAKRHTHDMSFPWFQETMDHVTSVTSRSSALQLELVAAFGEGILVLVTAFVSLRSHSTGAYSSRMRKVKVPPIRPSSSVDQAVVSASWKGIGTSARLKKPEIRPNKVYQH